MEAREAPVALSLTLRFIDGSHASESFEFRGGIRAVLARVYHALAWWSFERELLCRSVRVVRHAGRSSRPTEAWSEMTLSSLGADVQVSFALVGRAAPSSAYDELRSGVADEAVEVYVCEQVSGDGTVSVRQYTATLDITPQDMSASSSGSSFRPPSRSSRGHRSWSLV